MDATVAGYWDEHVGQHVDCFLSWEANTPVQEHQNRRVCDGDNVNPVYWFWKKFGPFEHVASIGSGNGILERFICALDGWVSITGHDISPASVEIAKASCSEFVNVVFEVADLNSKQLPRECFDVVFAHGALHHIERLDWCLGEISSALKPGGLLFVNDYVGPQRFQYSDLQLRLANELLCTVPSRWRKNATASRCDPESLRIQDPSEAVNSHFIEDTIKGHFTVIERKPRGGTLLAPIFGMGCLDESILNSAEGLQCIEAMAEREGHLIDEQVLPSDHVVIVAKPRR